MPTSSSAPKSQTRSPPPDNSTSQRHNHKLNVPLTTPTAPRNILPHRLSAASSHGSRSPANLSGQIPSIDEKLNFEHAPSTSWAQASDRSNAVDDFHFSPTSQFSDDIGQDMSDFGMDEYAPFGPLLPADDDSRPAHQHGSLRDDLVTQAQMEAAQHWSSSISSPTHVIGTSHTSRLSRNNPSDIGSSPVPKLQLRTSTFGVPHQENPHDHQMTDDHTSSLRPPGAASYLEAYVEDESPDDETPTIHPRTRRRVSSAAAVMPSEFSVPSPNDQAEERQVDEKNAVIEQWKSNLDSVENYEEEQGTSSGVSDAPSEGRKAPASVPVARPEESSQGIMADFERMTEQFDGISIAPTWGSRVSGRRRSLDSSCPSEFSITNAAGITLQTPTTHSKPKSLLNKLRSYSHTSTQPLGRPKTESIPTFFQIPSEVIKEGNTRRSFSGVPSDRNPPSTYIPESPVSPKGIVRSLLKRSRSTKGHTEKSGSPGLITLLRGQGGPPAPMIKSPPEEVSPFSPPPVSELFRPSSTETPMDVDWEESASPSGSDVSRGVMMAVPSSPTNEAFQRHACLSSPLIQPYLLKRVTDQQSKNYRRLVSYRRNPKSTVAEHGSWSDEEQPNDTKLGRLLTPRDNSKQWRIMRGTVPPMKNDADVSDSAQLATFPRGVPLPPVDLLPASFKCPWCSKMLRNIKKPSDWTKHVLEDLQPYICTFSECASTSLFKRKADWVRHESEKHRQIEKWECDVPGCSKTVFRKDNFTQHLSREHSTQDQVRDTPHRASHASAGTPGNDNPARVASCRRVSNKHPNDEPCRFCGKRFDEWKKLTKHLAEHMEHISLPLLALVEHTVNNGETFSYGHGEHLLPSSDVEHEGSISGNGSSFDPQKEASVFGGSLPRKFGEMLPNGIEGSEAIVAGTNSFQAQNAHTWYESQIQSPNSHLSRSSNDYANSYTNRQQSNLDASVSTARQEPGPSYIQMQHLDAEGINLGDDAWTSYVDLDLCQTESAQPGSQPYTGTIDFDETSFPQHEFDLTTSPIHEGPRLAQLQPAYSTFPGPSRHSYNNPTSESYSLQSMSSAHTNYEGQTQVGPSFSQLPNGHQLQFPLFDQPPAYLQQGPPGVPLSMAGLIYPNEAQQQLQFDATRGGPSGYVQQSPSSNPVQRGNQTFQNFQNYPGQNAGYYTYPHYGNQYPPAS